jgi:hypothetical protein
LAQKIAAQKITDQDIATPKIMTQDNRWDLALDAALAGVWWHSQTARDVATRYTDLGIDGPCLAAALTGTLAHRFPDLIY